MRKLIRVTQEDIDEGCVGDLFSCPVALALKRTLNTEYVSVTSTLFAARESGLKRTPKSVERFVRRFDREKPVTPFNFYFDPCKEVPVSSV